VSAKKEISVEFVNVFKYEDFAADFDSAAAYVAE